MTSLSLISPCDLDKLHDFDGRDDAALGQNFDQAREHLEGDSGFEWFSAIAHSNSYQVLPCLGAWSPRWFSPAGSWAAFSNKSLAGIGGAAFFIGVTAMEISFGEWMMGFIFIKFVIVALWYEYV